MDEKSIWCEVHDHRWKALTGRMAGWSRCQVCGNQVETGQSEETDDDEEWD